MKIREGDNVVVTTGKYKGRQGQVEAVDPDDHQVKVAGVNIVTRHLKNRPNQQQAGGAIEVHKPIDVSNVKLICPHCEQSAKIKFEGEGRTKQRACSECAGALNE